MSLYISLHLFWKCLWTFLWKTFENMFENMFETCLKNVWKMFDKCLKTFKTFSNTSKNISNCLKNCNIDNWTIYNCFAWELAIEGTTVALGTLREPRKKEKRNVLLLHCEKISTSSRAKRAHGREAPRKTQTRGSERSTENPTGAEFWPKSVPSGRRVLILVILGRLSKEEIKRFSICFSNF